jgi:tetratricopeptide (TPR) repeat protein
MTNSNPTAPAAPAHQPQPQPQQRLAQLEAFLQQDPANLALRTDAVHAAIEQGLLDRAAQLANDMDPALAQTPQARHLQATVLLAQGQYAKARELLRALVADGVNAPAVLFNLGYASFRAGDAEAAVQVLSPLLDQPDAPETTLAWLMRSLHQLGRPEDAVTAWNAAAPRFKTTEAHAVASLACLDTDRADEARRLSDAALAQGSTQAEALVTRATLAVGDGQEDLAEQLLARARAALPDDGRIFATVGTARMARTDLAGAEKAFRQAVALMPQHVGTWHALGWCQILSGQLEAARETFNTALALDRNFGETHGGLAVIDALEGKTQAAQEGIARAERLGRDGMAYRYAQALLSGQARDAEKLRALALRLLGKRSDITAAAGLINRFQA